MRRVLSRLLQVWSNAQAGRKSVEQLVMAIGRIVGGVAGLGLVGASVYGVAGEDESVRNESGR